MPTFRRLVDSLNTLAHFKSIRYISGKSWKCSLCSTNRFVFGCFNYSKKNNWIRSTLVSVFVDVDSVLSSGPEDSCAIFSPVVTVTNQILMDMSDGQCKLGISNSNKYFIPFFVLCWTFIRWTRHQTQELDSLFVCIPPYNKIPATRVLVSC